ncbi:peroxiredoxin family protein [Aneurinibacillus sp. REN35]|uniref:peroxiredoxin family protein n=1 Tax=Aneurinibacillus sp. REN35 TaxID=3237286 RepID=UPI003528E2D3
MKKWIAVVTLLVLAGWMFYSTTSNGNKSANGAYKADPEQSSAAKIGINQGDMAPDFVLKAMDGTEKKLSDFRGKKVIVNMWATWCPPCRAEMPDMQKFYEKNKQKGIEIVAINLTQSEKNKNSVPAFIQEFGLTFPVFLDEKSEIANTFQVQAIPTSYIIDSNGIIHQAITGPMDYDTMEKLTSDLP